MVVGTSTLPGTQYALAANVPTQIPVDAKGVTVVNDSGLTLTLATDEYFTSPINLPNGASLPWRSSPLWVMATQTTTVSVVVGTYNYWSPNVNTSFAQAEELFTISGITLPGTYTFYRNFDIKALSNTEVLIVSVLSSQPYAILPPLSCVVKGNTSNFDYLGVGTDSGFGTEGAASYLGGLNTSIPPSPLQAIWYVPVSVAIDTSFTVYIGTYLTSLTTPVTISVFSDPNLYKEDIFYNGATGIQVAASGSAGTLLTGPARLLNLTLEAPSAPESMSIIASEGFVSENIIVLPMGQFTSVALPDNTLLRYGGSITFSGGNAAVAYTYP